MWRLKVDRVLIERMCAGREFQVEGADTEKAREEKLLRPINQPTNTLNHDDHTQPAITIPSQRSQYPASKHSTSHGNIGTAAQQLHQGSHRPQTLPPLLLPYFKHTSFTCQYIRRDITCKHDAINIHHAHCGLVGPD